MRRRLGKYKTDGILLLTLLFAAGVNEVNDLKPHVFDPISPAIENHFGNVPLSMAIVLTPMTIWKAVIRDSMVQPRSERTARVIDAVLPLALLGVAALANVANEINDSLRVGNNYEFWGDVGWGVAAAGLVALAYALPAGIKLLKNRAGETDGIG